MRCLIFSLLCLLGAGAATAHAEPIRIFVNRSAWEAAVTNTTTIDFEGVPSGKSELLSSTHVISGVTFSVDPSSTLSLVDPACCAPGLSDSLLTRSDFLPHLIIEPPPDTFALGFDYNTDLDGFLEATIDFPGLEASLLFFTPGRRTFDFLGIISELPIKSVRLDVLAEGAGILDVDDVTLADVKRDVPEPGALALFAAAAAASEWRRRRRRTAALAAERRN